MTTTERKEWLRSLITVADALVAWPYDDGENVAGFDCFQANLLNAPTRTAEKEEPIVTFLNKQILELREQRAALTEQLEALKARPDSLVKQMWEADQKVYRGQELQLKEARRLLSWIESACGTPDAAEGCRNILKRIREFRESTQHVPQDTHQERKLEVDEKWLNKAVVEFYALIAHGDEKHREWLANAFEEFWDVDIPAVARSAEKEGDK